MSTRRQRTAPMARRSTVTKAFGNIFGNTFAVAAFIAATVGTLLTAQTVQGQSMAPASSGMIGPVDGKDLVATDLERVSVGSMAPDFTLPKYGGGTTTLSAMRGGKNVVLVFYRGYWCPYCVAQLKELRTLLAPELKSDTELLVVSIDNEAQTKMAITRIAADGKQPEFAFLSDTAHAVIARYGVLNPSGSRRGIPHPAAFVIDKRGVVRWRDIQTDYKVRPTNAAILAALQSLPTK